MGQKTNPIILRLNLTKNWKNNYPKNHRTESALYDFKYHEIKEFCYMFLKKNNFQLLNFKLFNTTNHSIKIYIHIISLKEINNIIEKKKFISKLKKYQIINTNYNIKYTNSKSTQQLTQLKKQLLFHLLLKSLSVFLKNKNIILLIKQPNQNIMSYLNKKQLNGLKGQISQLKRFQENPFFNASLKLLFYCTHFPNSAETIAHFIAKNLKKHKKRHNLFLQFIKIILYFFCQNSLIKLNGIKIKISGRLNGRLRARNKTIYIKKKIPNLTLNTNIDYSNVTSYTANGTLGIKVWINYKN